MYLSFETFDKLLFVNDLIFKLFIQHYNLIFLFDLIKDGLISLAYFFKQTIHFSHILKWHFGSTFLKSQ